MYFFRVVLVLAVAFFGGCGYTPSSKFARNVVGQKVSTQVIISSTDPQNTVLIKDAVDSAIIKSFQSSLTDQADADTHLVISLQGVGYSPIQYDNNGYVIGYRMTTSLGITMTSNGITKSYSVSGTYDFSIEANAIISDQTRFEAIKYSAAKAISSFVAQVAAQGAKGQKDE